MRTSRFILLSLVLTLSITCDAFFGGYECANKPYNVYTHFCCSDILYENTGFNKCCMGVIFDTRNAFCWIGLRLTSYLRRCGGKNYNSRYESCCGDEVMETWTGTKECREGKIVDRE
ncbi:hypothetical protein LSAT2_026093 [Lamellibrachia satsuma]|nr:hypothetical protein LSAT2_026093 [Lamellibrachia satsuma]